MPAGDEGGDEKFGQLVSWIATHVVVDANFEGTPMLVAADADVLCALMPPSEGLDTGEWRWETTDVGPAIAVGGPDPESDGPWVWVLASDDGPLASVEISPDLRTSTARPQYAGLLPCPSGRLAISSPTGAQWWGRRLHQEQVEDGAEFRIADDVPGPLREGYAILVDVPREHPVEVWVTMSSNPSCAISLSLRIPGPDWLPKPLPIIDGS